MVEASSAAYRGATQDIQQKLRRVIEVWRHRNIFDPTTQSAIENAINGKKDYSSSLQGVE